MGVPRQRRCPAIRLRHGFAALRHDFPHMQALLILLLLCMSTAAAAGQSKLPADARRVQSFLDGAGAVCRAAPSQLCVNAGWNFAAAAPKRGLTLSDVKTLRQRLGTWYRWRQAALGTRERIMVGLGLLLANGLGIDRLHAAFDADGDGLVTQPELLADVTLDKRPLGKVLSDPKAVDRAALAHRLDLPFDLLNGFFRKMP